MEKNTIAGTACALAVKLGLSSGAKFFYDTNLALEKLNKQPNWVVYFVDGETHTFEERSRFYHTTSAGVGTIAGTGDIYLWKWVDTVVNGNSTDSWAATSQCHGELREPASSAGIKYCNANLFPKYLQPGLPSMHCPRRIV